MEERRKLHRGRTYLGGRIAFNNRCSTLDCVVRNLSQDGAKIVFSHAASIPGDFDVMIHRNGASRRARVTWRGETQAGIRFLESVGDVVSIESALRLTQLHAQREALARRIAELTEPA